MERKRNLTLHLVGLIKKVESREEEVAKGEQVEVVVGQVVDRPVCQRWPETGLAQLCPGELRVSMNLLEMVVVGEDRIGARADLSILGMGSMVDLIVLGREIRADIIMEGKIREDPLIPEREIKADLSMSEKIKADPSMSEKIKADLDKVEEAMPEPSLEMGPAPP